MEVRSGALTGVADIADALADNDGLAGFKR
jgi:hypothetical protein